MIHNNSGGARKLLFRGFGIAAFAKAVKDMPDNGRVILFWKKHK